MLAPHTGHSVTLSGVSRMTTEVLDTLGSLYLLVMSMVNSVIPFGPVRHAAPRSWVAGVVGWVYAPQRFCVERSDAFMRRKVAAEPRQPVAKGLSIDYAEMLGAIGIDSHGQGESAAANVVEVTAAVTVDEREAIGVGH
jgi:hypothetical protein